MLCHRRCARTLAIKHDKRRSTPIKVPQCGLRGESVRGTTPKAREDQILSKARRNTGTLRTVTEPCRWRRGPTTARLLASQLGIVGRTLSSAADAAGLGGITGLGEGNPLQDRVYRSRRAPSRSKCWERSGRSPSQWLRLTFGVGRDASHQFGPDQAREVGQGHHPDA